MPLGYFSRMKTGDILATTTTELGMLELNGMKMIHLCEDCRESFGEWMGENGEREGAGT